MDRHGAYAPEDTGTATGVPLRWKSTGSRGVVYETIMITDAELQEAESRIIDQVADQCLKGAQSEGLGDNAKACGQFFGDINKRQRGLHGTAAALRLLAEAQVQKASLTVPKLVSYLSERKRFDGEKKKKKSPQCRSFEDDENNVIKLSEALYALHFVKPAQCQKDELVASLVKRLKEGYQTNEGWSHFLNDKGATAPLPTAFAILALCKNGYEGEFVNAINYVKQTAFDEGPTKDAKGFTESSVQIFCLYALVFRKETVNEIPADELSRIRTSFARQWRNHERLLDQDLEQNIEYSIGPTNYYVRIPWQLYLLALAAQVSPWRIYSYIVQKKLGRILNDTKSGGFYYPYSGRALSTRTNAILYDTLKTIRHRSRHSGISWLVYGWDNIRMFLGHRYLRLIALFLVVYASAASIRAWLLVGDLKDLGPDLTGALFGFFIASLIQSLRKER
jgi:hypothetical protein